MSNRPREIVKKLLESEPESVDSLIAKADFVLDDAGEWDTGDCGIFVAGLSRYLSDKGVAHSFAAAVSPGADDTLDCHVYVLLNRESERKNWVFLDFEGAHDYDGVLMDTAVKTGGHGTPEIWKFDSWHEMGTDLARYGMHLCSNAALENSVYERLKAASS